MKKKVIIGFISLAFTTLIFNSNVNSQEVFSNAEALEYASSKDKLYCCYPYDKTCVTYGDHTTVMGSLRKNSPCN